MSLIFRVEDYARYVDRVGEATYLDVTRRTDPARAGRVWDNLQSVVDAFGPPWIIQLWTKDPAGTLARGGALLRELADRGTTIAAQVTITGLSGTIWEPDTPSEARCAAGLADLIALAGGPDHAKWRYDPVIPTVHDIDRFRRLAGRVSALGLTRCVLNFIAPPGRYRRVDPRLAAALPGWAAGMPGYDAAWQGAAAAEIVDVAAGMGLSVACCAESAALSGQVPGLLAAACGDHAWFVALSGRDPGRVPARGSRGGCGCAAYFDVGVYGQWARCHRCLYCYAG